MKYRATVTMLLTNVGTILVREPCHNQVDLHRGKVAKAAWRTVVQGPCCAAMAELQMFAIRISAFDKWHSAREKFHASRTFLFCIQPTISRSWASQKYPAPVLVAKAGRAGRCHARPVLMRCATWLFSGHAPYPFFFRRCGHVTTEKSNSQRP